MAHNAETVLGLVKARLNRLPSDTTLDGYLGSRIDAADAELERQGITLEKDDVADQVLLSDVVVWQYQSRDKSGAMPDWLTLRIRERWLNQKTGEGPS